MPGMVSSDRKKVSPQRICCSTTPKGMLKFRAEILHLLRDPALLTEMFRNKMHFKFWEGLCTNTYLVAPCLEAQ